MGPQGQLPYGLEPAAEGLCSELFDYNEHPQIYFFILYFVQ